MDSNSTGKNKWVEGWEEGKVKEEFRAQKLTQRKFIWYASKMSEYWKINLFWTNGAAQQEKWKNMLKNLDSFHRPQILKGVMFQIPFTLKDGKQ